MSICTPDMGTKLLRLWLHEAEAFEAKASTSALASASWLQKLKASTSWFGKSFGFSFSLVTSQVQNITIGFVVSKPEKLNIFHFQIIFGCIFCLNFNKWQVIQVKMGIYNSWEAPGLRLQLPALKKLRLRLQLRAFQKAKLRLRLQLHDLIKASALLRLRNLRLHTHVWCTHSQDLLSAMDERCDIFCTYTHLYTLKTKSLFKFISKIETHFWNLRHVVEDSGIFMFPNE